MVDLWLGRGGTAPTPNQVYGMYTFCPWKGGNPVRNSYRMTPKDHLGRGRVRVGVQGRRVRVRVRTPKGLRARLRVWLRGRR